MRIQIVLLSVMATFLFQGCASLQRSKASGYTHTNRAYGDGLDDDDIRPRTFSSLQKAEKTLEGRRETEQYYKNKAYMRNDRERMAFLALDSFETRERWLASQGVDGSNTPHTAPMQALVNINDITVGMTKQAVRDSWGEPETVEVAGNPIYGNERWSYSEQLPSAEGYQTEHRLVYFEDGRVKGWTKR